MNDVHNRQATQKRVPSLRGLKAGIKPKAKAKEKSLRRELVEFIASVATQVLFEPKETKARSRRPKGIFSGMGEAVRAEQQRVRLTAPPEQNLELATADTSSPKKARGGRMSGSSNERTLNMIADYEKRRAQGLSDEAARAKTAAEWKLHKGTKNVRRTLDRILKKHKKGRATLE
jgi:hypothetical protein